MDYELINASEVRTDQTCSYDVKFNKEFTLEEFINEILKKNEWGIITINGFEVEYKNNEIISPNLFIDLYNKKIIKCSCNGGWGNMDYQIKLEVDGDYEFTLQDREAKIQSTNDLHNLEKYGYVSFSGGYDSCVTSGLLDYSLPGNKIPRVYFNTGIEYKEMVDFVKELAKNDDRFIIINSGVNIKKMLEENGYPFKSKQHSHNWSMYVNNGEEVNKIIQELKDNPKKQFDYDFIHNLDRGTKTIIKYVFGLREKTTKKRNTDSVVRERERESNRYIYEYIDCP